MEEQKKAPILDESFLQNLTIRTMEGDLKMLAGEKPEQPLFVPSPSQPPEKPIPVGQQLLAQARAAFEQKMYQETVDLSQKIIQDKTASWLLSFRANRLIKKVKKEQEKLTKQRQQKLQAEMLQQATPAKPKAEPPLPPKPIAPAPEIPKETPKPVIQPPKPKVAYQPTISSALPSYKLPTPTAEEVRTGKRTLTLGVIFGSLAVVIVAGILGYLYFFWPKPPEPPPPEPEPPLPSPMFSMEHQEIIQLTKTELDTLPSKIQSLAQQNQTAGHFTYLIVKQINGQTKYPDFSSLLSALAIDLSLLAKCDQASPCPETDLFANIDANQYSLFIYHQKELPEHPLSPKQARLGLVVKLKDLAKTKTAFLEQEFQLPQIFEPMLLGKEPTTIIKEFQDNLYLNVPIRYINFPDKYLSIDYVFLSDWLIIATSKESAYATLEKIVGTAP